MGIWSLGVRATEFYCRGCRVQGTGIWGLGFAGLRLLDSRV